jgi:serine/threonine protein kinase
MIRSLVGTVNWQAPELWHPHPRYDYKVDVFSAAMVYWEMMSGWTGEKVSIASTILTDVRNIPGRGITNITFMTLWARNRGDPLLLDSGNIGVPSP